MVTARKIETRLNYKDLELSEAAANCLDDEQPLINEASPTSEEDQPSWSYLRRPVGVSALSVLGLLAMATCAFMLAHRQVQHRHEVAAAPPPPAGLTPRMLFESPSFRDVATENILRLSGGRLGSKDRPRIQNLVAEQARNMSVSLWQQYPEEGDQLDSLQLSEEQQSAILHVMQHMSDPRVQHLGQEIGHAILDSYRSKASDPEAAKRHLQDYLSTRLPYIKQLRDEVIPEELRGPDSGDESDVLFGEDGLDLRQSLDGWDFRLQVAGPGGGASASEAPHERRLGAAAATAATAGDMTDAQMESEMETGMEQEVAEQAAKAMIIKQANTFWRQLQKVAGQYGIDLKPLQQALNNVDVKALSTCVMANLMSRDLNSLMQCGMEFAQAAMVVFQTLMGHPPPTTTTPAWSLHGSFEDMMADM